MTPLQETDFHEFFYVDLDESHHLKEKVDSPRNSSNLHWFLYWRVIGNSFREVPEYSINSSVYEVIYSLPEE